MHSWWPLVTQIYCFSSEKNVRTQCHRYPPVMAAHNYQAHCTLWNHFTFDSHRNHVLSESGVITCIIQVRTLSGREGKWFAWGHTTGEWLRWILTQGCDATNTHPSSTHPSYTHCISILHIIPGVYPAFSFLHYCRHWDGFAPPLTPNTVLFSGHLLPPPFSVFLSLAAPLHFFLLWTIHIPSSQKHPPFFLIKAACRLTQQHAPVYCGEMTLRWQRTYRELESLKSWWTMVPETMLFVLSQFGDRYIWGVVST